MTKAKEVGFRPTDLKIGCILDTDIEVYEVEVPLRKGQSYAEVIFIGDLHIGHEQFSESHLKRYLKLLKANPHIKIVGMGDYLEACEFSTHLSNEQLRTQKQIECFLKLFTPLKDRILAMVYGNHDERIQKAMKNAIDLLDYLRLKLENLHIICGKPQGGLLLLIKVGKVTYSVYLHHSSTGAIVNPDTQLKRTALNWIVSLIVHGHVHRKLWKNRTFFTIGKTKEGYRRVIVRQFQLLTGCFLRYPTYAEAKSYPVTDIGAPIIRFYGNEERIEYIDPLTAKEYAKFFKRA